MALTSALNMTLSGMMTTELKTNLSSQNITNADKEGYTRKSLDTRYITTTSGSVPISGLVVGAGNAFLTKALSDDTSTYSKANTVNLSLDYYNTQLGSTDGNNSLSTYTDNLYSSLKALATTPEISSNKADAVSTANYLAGSLRSMSATIQTQRAEAEKKIATSVDNVNAILDRIDMLNDKIAETHAQDASMAEYEDQRNVEIQRLSAEMNIQYFYNSNNLMQIYTSSGQALLLSDAHHLSYNVTNIVNGSVTYPTGFSSIDLDGVDITNAIVDGNMGANIQLRDQTYIGEQAKLDELASVLKTQVNTLLNTGASNPPRNVMTGSLAGLTGATAFTASGTIRVAITDGNGTIQNYSDINLGAMTTINNVLTALNAVPGLTATLNSGGQLNLSVSPASNGVVINPLASQVTSSSNESFSQYFGLNDLFVGTNAEDIQVSSYLLSNPDYLSTGVLSSSATLAVGDRGVAKGDGSVADALANMLLSAQSFSAAGNFSAQSSTLLGYAQAYIANAANQSRIAQNESDTALTVYKASSDMLTSTSGVNIDEETAKMLVYQNQYAASAQVVSTIQKMLDDLINAMR
ncbi:MAG: hypothetical protein JNK24_06010 [Alphaproteobacteria bacterium]|nr:hypothetical protein [Alphaproteobacteria bacterium]